MELQGDEYRLPRIEIPKFRRPAQEITQLLRSSRNVSSVFLFSGMLGKAANSSYFAVLESIDGLRLRPHGMDWFTIQHALSDLFSSSEERTALESSYRKATRAISSDQHEPFSKLGWMRKLEDWAKDVLSAQGYELKDFQQMNGCETFSLIRFDTTQEPVWFKAVGEPNLHEYAISQALARLLPNYVPNILATKSEWHGWLMADGGGVSLWDVQDLRAWESAVTTLAHMQIDSIGIEDEFLDAGCRDLRLGALLESVEPFFDTMADLMEQQTKVPPAILSRNQLAALAATVKDALQCLAVLGIPDTLGHSDFNPGNIIVGPERCTFLDWAEAHVGHPLLTYEYFLAHLRKDYPQLAARESELRAAYSRLWNSVVSPEQVSEAYLFSPLVAVFAYAASSSVWRDTERLKVPVFQGYLRSLTRRMKQEADSILRRRVECLN
jgi:hypothetical protein